jgi:ABC-type phosphate transport system ATPase subunit
MASDIRFKHPFTCIIGGPTGSGRSTFCIRFLENLDTLCTEPDFRGGIIWCYSEQSAVPHHQLIALKKKVQIREGPPENFENTEVLSCLFILDDLLNEVYSRAV